MENPVQWMTLQKLRDELDRPHWESTDMDRVLASGPLR